MKRLDSVYLEDIIDAIGKIDEYIAGLTEEEFYENTLVQDSVVRRLEIIGEAVKNMPAELKRKYPAVNWKSISGMRDIFAHAYFRISQKLVWRTITGELPILKGQVAGMKNDLERE